MMPATGYRRRILVAIAAVGLVFASVGVAPASDAGSARSSNIFGVVGHFLHNNVFFRQYTAHWTVERALPVVKELGATWVHEGLYAYTKPGRMLVPAGKTDARTLAEVRRNRAHVDRWLSRYDEAGIEVCLAILTTFPSEPNAAQINAEFSKWVAELVARHPAIVAVQMHNEPNLSFFWNGTPEQYVDTYRPFAEQIRAARPEVEIVVGGMSSLSWPQAVDWFRRAADHGMLEFADAVSVHPYNTTAPPETDPHLSGSDRADPEHLESAIAAFWRRVSAANHDGRPLKLYFTEFGYSTSASGLAAIGSEAKQAAYLARLFLIYQDLRLRGLPLAAAFWYDLKDDGTDAGNEQHNFGLVSFDLTRRKPAFDAFRALANAFPDIDDLEAVDLNVEPIDHAAAVKTKTWRRKSDGATIVAFWRLDQSAEASADFRTELRIPVEGAVGSASLQRADGGAPQPTPIDHDEGVLAVPVSVELLPAWIVLDGGEPGR